MSINRVERFIRDARESDEYWEEGAILDFTEQLAALMKKQNVSHAELAKRIEVPPAYISGTMCGNASYTLASMVRIARALGAEVRVQITEADAEVERP